MIFSFTLFIKYRIINVRSIEMKVFNKKGKSVTRCATLNIANLLRVSWKK